jgi:DNA replication protein DnaC
VARNSEPLYCLKVAICAALQARARRHSNCPDFLNVLRLVRDWYRPSFTAAELVNQLEKAQKQYTLDKFLGQLDRAHLLICVELGYVSFSRGGVELLFRVFSDRYERGSVLVASNLPFGDWGQVFQGERMTGALLDRLTHRCHIFEMNGESYRFRESMKSRKGRKPA